MKPTLSILIPTRGGGALPRTVQSILQQGVTPEDDVLIVGDGYNEDTERQVSAFGPPFRYIFTPKPSGDWGHTPCNYGQPMCRGDYIMVQGDDDIFLPQALDHIRAAAASEPGRPLMFRFITNDRHIRWLPEHNHELKETYVGDHNLIAPNVPGKLGAWEAYYRGDLAWVRGTLAHYPEGAAWHKRILTLQRPQFPTRYWRGETEEATEFHYSPGLDNDHIRVATSTHWTEDGKAHIRLTMPPEHRNQGYFLSLVTLAQFVPQADAVLHLPADYREAKMAAQAYDATPLGPSKDEELMDLKWTMD